MFKKVKENNKKVLGIQGWTKLNYPTLHEGNFFINIY